MRQAGRYLPEYRALRERVGFLELCRTPELAVEASLMPLRRFALDAAIVFSDIMIPIVPMGCGITFAPGPRLEQPVRTAEQVRDLRVPDMAEDVPFVGEAVRLLVRELEGRTPVIGFCGAPFTLAAYLAEGASGQGFEAIQTLMFTEPATVTRLLEKLADAMADYLRLQIAAGAHAVQIFDSWAGLMSVEQFRDFAMPALRRVLAKLEPRRVPVIYFALAAPHLLGESAKLEADVLGVCWRTPLDVARRTAGDSIAIQGNLHPHALLAPPAVVRERTLEVLERAGDRPGHILNLGHGILPQTPLESVEAMVETATERAERPA
jgi:uroporphyrinogen decarboxylase